MKSIKRYILVCALAGAFTSCDLNVVPPAELSSDNFWKTEKDAWHALNGCYQSAPALDIGDEMCTDNAHSHKPWEGNFELLQQNGISTAAPYGVYSFTSIRTANTFIHNVDNCKMDEALKSRMKAEARFFRAFAYLNLTLYYGKVAIIKEPLAYDAPNVPRNSVEEVRAFILNELEEVSGVLPEKYSGGFLQEKGRVTRSAALALRARAALYFGNYPEAEKSAKAVIDGGQHSLFRLASLTESQLKEAKEMELFVDFDNLGIDKDKFIKGMFSYDSFMQGKNCSPDNPEFILTHEYMADKDGADYNRYTAFVPWQMTVKAAWSSYEPMQDLVDAYWDVDGKTMRNDITVDQRKGNYEKIWNHVKNFNSEQYKAFVTGPELFTYDYMKEFKNRDSRLYVTVMFPFKGWHGSPKGEFYYKWDPSWPNKVGGESWTGYSYRKMVSVDPYDDEHSPDDYPTIRYAEVLLTFAEAHLMNSGYDAEVKNALNDIRDRCGMPNVPDNLSKQEAIDFLRNERRIELAVEGHRYDDVRRYGSEYCRKYLNGPTTNPNGYVVVNKKWDDRLMLMPIPTSAMDLNPLLKDDQNPGY